MSSKTIARFAGGIPALLPLALFAQSLAWFTTIVTQLQALMRLIVPLLIAVAVVVFFWGVIKYMTAGEDPERRKAGRGLMIYGVIAIFVMVALWGIIQLLVTLTGATTGGTITGPSV